MNKLTAEACLFADEAFRHAMRDPMLPSLMYEKYRTMRIKLGTLCQRAFPESSNTWHLRMEAAMEPERAS